MYEYVYFLLHISQAEFFKDRKVANKETQCFYLLFNLVTIILSYVCTKIDIKKHFYTHYFNSITREKEKLIININKFETNYSGKKK